MANTSQGLDIGKMALEGFGQVMDSMDLVKRAWSNFSLATPFTPTLNVEELDKRITELRAVEQWLALNQNMLRNTIQGLEVQRGTLNAINTMSESFGKMAKPADDTMAQTVARFAAAAAQKAAANPSPEPAADRSSAGGAFDWSPFAMPSSFFNQPTAAPEAAAPEAAGTEAGDTDDPDGIETNGVASDADNEAQGSDAVEATAARRGEAPAGSRADDNTAAAPAAMNPMAWWDMLQANFRQIAQAAVGGDAAPDASGAAPGTSASGSAGRAANRSQKGKAAGGKPAGGRSAGSKSGGSKSAGSKSAGNKATGSKSGGGKSAAGRTAGTRTATAASNRARRGKAGGTGEPE
jgi:hypothetical protein